MIFKKAYLEEAHQYSSNHKKELQNDYRCGCFYCEKIFSPVEITEWIEDSLGTALCPSCGIDSVIGEYSGFRITPMFLNAMYKYWFVPEYSNAEQIEVDDEVFDFREIRTEQDIDDLMTIYHGFHDSVIAAVSYRSGYAVGSDRSVDQYGNHNVSVIFHSQWDPRLVELCFENVRKIYINGLRENYMNIIDDATLCFRDITISDEIMGEMTKHGILWADYSDFDISDLDQSAAEYDMTFILADSLKWRIIEDDN